MLLEAYRAVRRHTSALCAPFAIEDLVVQSMPDASPARWHLAHTTWFFETFVLAAHAPDYALFDATFTWLFNSYYNGVGAQFPRARRGTQSRPTVEQVMAWRAHVDAAMTRLLARPTAEIERVTRIGLHHEQQHQELLITDLKHALCTCGLVVSIERPEAVRDVPLKTDWVDFKAAFQSIGHAKQSFCFDNELPVHQAWTPAFSIARGLVTNADFLRFIEAGGYRDPDLWMSDGWAAVQANSWIAPLYWEEGAHGWQERTWMGRRPLALHAPVRHVSWFEADAYARWAGARLPTEFEWERAAPDLQDAHGVVWQWTASAYRPYPGYQPLPGTLGEYNGKFMHGQLVLRGSSQATPPGHARDSYRNFFQADKRWQFSGIRLARDL